ncbi:helix-turn-helix domain-containing protein [soil metagenome]
MGGSDIDAQVRHIGSLLQPRIDQIARQIVTSIRHRVQFYRSGDAVSDDELLDTVTSNLQLVFGSLHSGQPFDTSSAVSTGARRARSGAPLPVLMDAYRIGTHHIWTEIAELADRPDITPAALIQATELMWQAQDVYTEAMTEAYRHQSIQLVLDIEAERSALTEALFQGGIGDHRTLWEVADLLRLPQRGPFVAIAATCPAVGSLALPAVAAKLRTVDIYSSWRLLPDLQVGIAHVPSDTARQAVLEVLERTASTRVGVSPRFDDLAATPAGVRYARAAANARATNTDLVTVFDDSVLSVAAVSAPEVSERLAEIVLDRFGDLADGEREILFKTFRVWMDNSGSIPTAATLLYCHPNTVRYRLRRIEERTGRSLSSPRDVAELCLAFATYWNSPG